jgi:hypothetical protein
VLGEVELESNISTNAGGRDIIGVFVLAFFACNNIVITCLYTHKNQIHLFLSCQIIQKSIVENRFVLKNMIIPSQGNIL